MSRQQQNSPSINSPMTSTNQGFGTSEAYCRHPHRECMLSRIEGYDFCVRHILEDKTAPFKRCAFVSKAGLRCPIAALRQERKDGFCHEHARKAQVGRQRFNRKRRPKETCESLVEDLAASNSGGSKVNHHEGHRRGRHHSDSLASKSLDYASSSDSESEPQQVGQSWREDGDSEAENMDSDQEDILKYAGVYSTEEVALILRDKLINLQALYIDQFKRLKHVLKTKRKKYLTARKEHLEAHGSLKQYQDDSSQTKNYAKLCAVRRYHKRYGKEALLHRQFIEKRKRHTEGANYKPPSFPQCVFADEGVQCNGQVVPLSKFCQKHILHDPSQVLYRICPFAESQCGRPVPTLFNMEFCSLHTKINSLKEEAGPSDLASIKMNLPEMEAGSTSGLKPTPSSSKHRTPLTTCTTDRTMDLEVELEGISTTGGGKTGEETSELFDGGEEDEEEER